MKRIKPIQIRFIGLDSPENKPNLQIAYNRLFALAEEAIRRERALKAQQTVDNKQ